MTLTDAQPALPGMELPTVLSVVISRTETEVNGEKGSHSKCVRLAFADFSVLFMHWSDDQFTRATAKVAGAALSEIGEEWTRFEDCPWQVQHFISEFAGEVSA